VVVAAAARTAHDGAVSASTAVRIEAATPDNTRRAYRRQWSSYAAWCAGHDRTALPATPETLAEYVSALADRGLSPSTVEQAVSTVRRAHRDAGHAGQPDTRGARLVLRTHRRAWAEQGRRVRQAPPAAVEQLRAMVGATDPDTTIGLRDRALLVLGFALMARRSELSALDLDDVAEVPEGLVVSIRMSKTDQDAVGAEVALPYGSHAETCPVRTFRAWRGRLAEHGITSGPLLRSIDRWGFVGESLSGGGIRLAVRAAAARAGLPGAADFSAHSLRAGGATSAARAGVPTATIAEHGRWSPTSPVVHTYVRQVDRWKDNPMAAVGL
jgi:site-specific recombinase XerD